MTLAYAAKLDLTARKTDVWAQKIDGLPLGTYGMVFASFQVVDNQNKAQFFQKTFLLANISMDVVLEMPFLTLSNGNI